MKLNQQTINRLNTLPILDVADTLAIKYTRTGAYRKALCICHDDHNPSMALNTKKNNWHCYACGEHGGVIDLVMRHQNLPFTEACQWLAQKHNIIINNHNYNLPTPTLQPTTTPHPQPTTMLPETLLTRFKPTSNTLTRALVQNHTLTPQQMHHAIKLYHISTHNDNPIFWQIDQQAGIHEGKIMHYQPDAHRSHTQNPYTISWLLKKEKQLPTDWKPTPCLFGQHLINNTPPNTTIAIVESEKTAIILSQLIPTLPINPLPNDTQPSTINNTTNTPISTDTNTPISTATTPPTTILWLATGGLNNLTPDHLLPLAPHPIILFPDTDTDAKAYNHWKQIAQTTNQHPIFQQCKHKIYTSNLLEQHATPQQKQRKIDIADLITESSNTENNTQ